jgi:hypothetical protein
MPGYESFSFFSSSKCYGLPFHAFTLFLFQAKCSTCMYNTQYTCASIKKISSSFLSKSEKTKIWDERSNDAEKWW